MVCIKKYIFLVLAFSILAVSGCNSENNIETAAANSTNSQNSNESKSQQIENTTEIENTYTESSSEDSEIENSEPIETDTTVVESEYRQYVDVSTQTTENISESTTDTISKSDIVSDKDNTMVAWSFKRNADHSPVIGYNGGIDISKYDGYYLGDTSEKLIYLTFDEGYEYGYTSSILDTLKANNVHAAFFLTKPFIESEPELTKRIANEGHVAGNHSVKHLSFPDETDEQLVYEIEETARYYKEITGKDMDRFVRPPKGEFSERTLDITKQLGYKTVFWSFAYADWDVNNQPGKDVAYKYVMDNYHNGGIFLLHAVSQSNAEALDSIIKGLKESGYQFASLHELN